MWTHVVWIVVGTDRSGRPRGVEKSTGRFYFTEEDANVAHSEMTPELRECHKVEECVIMSYDEFEILTTLPP